MSKRIRQWIGIASAVIAYYLVHEGAHFLYAVCTSVFKEIHFMGIGMQVVLPKYKQAFSFSRPED